MSDQAVTWHVGICPQCERLNRTIGPLHGADPREARALELARDPVGGRRSDPGRTRCGRLRDTVGAERGHEDIAQSVAELELLPALEADPDAPLLADGFSCRTQIESVSGRKARHLAEVLAERLPPQD